MRANTSHSWRWGVAAFSLFSAPPALAQSADEKAQDASKGPADSEDIVVTGVLGPRSIEKAPISITAVTGEQIAQQAPASAADLLKTVPGVFVNSALGEIRNVVFSRGVSANSLDADSGYFYVSLQEDGMPVEPVLVGNFGPDYFARPDIMLNHLEALRGGTAAITGPNAPGGIFNYLSRTGKSNPGTDIRAKIGLEGNGHNAYYRADAYHGGRIGSDLYYAVGGFYRHSVGARDPGFVRNRGGQVRANLLWDYGAGSLRFSAKYLDDRNGFDEFVPAMGFADPRIARPYSNLTTTIPSAGDRSYLAPDGSRAVWNPKDTVRSRSLSFGVDWDHDLGGSLHVENKARYAVNRSEWAVGAAISASPLTDFGTYFLAGTLGIPGQYTLRLPGGGVAAQVNSATGFDYTVTTNNLPGQNVLANGVETLVGFTPRFRDRTFQDMLTLRGQAGDHSLAAGAYFQSSRFTSTASAAGYGLLTLQPDPRFLDITFTTPAAPGATFQVTGPGGFANYGILSGSNAGDQQSIALFAGDSWRVADRLTVEGGVRYESIRYDIGTVTAIRPATGFGLPGADGNPLTLYDNALPTFGPALHVKRRFSYLNVTGSAAYAFSDRFNAYARFTQSEKAPAYNIIQSLDTPAEIATQFPKPQKIRQVELGLKYNARGLSLQAFPFYSKLSNVTDLVTFFDETGTAYSPPSVYGTIETWGVEVQANADLRRWFNLYAAVTLQSPKSRGFGTYLANLPVRSDDQFVTIPDGDADNNPRVIIRTTATVKPTDGLSIFATYSYLGRRAANRFNAFYLPGFSTVDLGAAWEVGPNLTLQANVNNLLNNYGIMSWSRSGSFLASLDRQGLRPRDVAAAGSNGLVQVIPSQPRAFFFTSMLKF